jgi:hypothetical protein
MSRIYECKVIEFTIISPNSLNSSIRIVGRISYFSKKIKRGIHLLRKVKILNFRINGYSGVLRSQGGKINDFLSNAALLPRRKGSEMN